LGEEFFAEIETRQSTMTFFDDNPEDSSRPAAGDDANAQRNPPAEPRSGELSNVALSSNIFPASQEPIDPSAPLAGDPITYAAAELPHAAIPAFSGATAGIPEDLRISWYWPHLILFVFFTFASFLVVQTVMFIYYGPKHPMPKEQLEQYLLSKPQFIFGTNVLWYASVFLFLYVTLAVLRDAPFWSSLGWKKLSAQLSSTWGGPWSYFLGGCALAIFVGIASSQVKDTDNMPIRELFKNRENAVLLMCMAVFVAPLVEETVFRGYLYPLLARIIYSVTRRFGAQPPEAIRTGMFSSVVITGVLFGLMHGAQLGWTWSVVGLLILVGVIFTFVRARTGTVLASFLLHLGYNSMIAVTTIIGTHGFTKIPTSP
jgi:membrane protease YdiL (CAAX protease family)